MERLAELNQSMENIMENEVKYGKGCGNWSKVWKSL